MSEEEELRLLRRKLMADIRKYGRRLTFFDLVEESIWCDNERKKEREMEKQIAAYSLSKTQRELYKVDAALKGLIAN